MAPLYPPARRADVVDEYHGVSVADPYRWLETADSEETRRWVEAQNALTRDFVLAHPDYDRLAALLKKRWDHPRYTVPERFGDWFWYQRNDGLQDQAVLYRSRLDGGGEEAVLDPNALSEDGTVALKGYHPSPDGTRLAYGVSSHGSDWSELHVLDLATGKEPDTPLVNLRFTSAAWHPRGHGFWYSRYPAEGELPEAERINHNKVYWHVVGTPQASDALVWEMPDDPLLAFAPAVSDDGNWLVLQAWRGTEARNRLWLRSIDDGKEAGRFDDFLRLFDDEDAEYRFVGNRGDRIFVQSNLDAPRHRLLAVKISSPGAEDWEEIHRPGEGEVLDRVLHVGGHFVLLTEGDAHHRCRILDEGGKTLREIELPGLGAVYGLSGRADHEFVTYGFTSFTDAGSHWRHDLASGETTLLRRSAVDFDGEPYETKQIFFQSKDGTSVPMFVIHRKGLELDGTHPCILYGYGGFGVSLLPSFTVLRSLWLEHGGVYAMANLRGGKEYGEAWRDAARFEKKQNTFDDFIAAAETLVAQGYTSHRRLASMGGSNGGLLVAATLVQRPDLWGAAISAVPVIDMLRYHRFTCGRYWTSEYGNAEERAEHFRFLHAYSPLHNVKEGTSHPPTLVLTADTDDRVVPSHGKKFVATMQEKDAGPGPVLLRVETRAGHGFGTPVTKRIEEQTDILAFLFRVFDMRCEKAQTEGGPG